VDDTEEEKHTYSKSAHPKSSCDIGAKSVSRFRVVDKKSAIGMHDLCSRILTKKCTTSKSSCREADSKFLQVPVNAVHSTGGCNAI
jgi:hypothetical protein